MTDDERIEAEFRKAMGYVRQTIALGYAIGRIVPGGGEHVTAMVPRLIAETERQVRRAIFAERVSPAERERRERLLDAFKAEMEQVAEEIRGKGTT